MYKIDTYDWFCGPGPYIYSLSKFIACCLKCFASYFGTSVMLWKQSACVQYEKVIFCASSGDGGGLSSDELQTSDA